MQTSALTLIENTEATKPRRNPRGVYQKVPGKNSAWWVRYVDAQGRYRLETNLPPPYAGRPRHIHVKLLRPGGRLLTTQLYFPGESRDAERALVVQMEKAGGGYRASYDFVIGPP